VHSLHIVKVFYFKKNFLTSLLQLLVNNDWKITLLKQNFLMQHCWNTRQTNYKYAEYAQTSRKVLLAGKFKIRTLDPLTINPLIIHKNPLITVKQGMHY